MFDCTRATAKYVAENILYVSERTAKRRMQQLRKILGLRPHTALTIEQVKQYKDQL